MDTSEIYVKMCDCAEIQEQWLQIFKITDYCFNRKTKEWGIYHFVKEQWKSGSLDKFIWCPRQDQIQNMVEIFMIKEKNMGGVWAMEQYFHEWFLNKAKIETYTTREQLWLSCYMYEKHQKIWDGNKWKKN